MKRLIISGLMVLCACVQATAGEILPSAEQRFSSPTTSEVPHLQRHVLPLLGRLGCNGRACHGSFQGQGGFRLSLFGYDFKMDHKALADGDKPRVDLQNPRQSLMLVKPTGTEDDHGGGHRLDVDSWQYRLLLRWIEAGAAPVDPSQDPSFVRMEVTPREIVAGAAGAKTQLKAVSYWSDGTIEDVTALCRFQTNDESIATVDPLGVITVVGRGDTHVVAFYDNGVVPVSVLLPVTDRSGKNYPAVPTPTKVDELVVGKLRKLGIVPSDLTSDGEFLRRVSLDMTGTLPLAEEVEAFLADKSRDKRARKIDELLERPAYAAWWATKLCDITGNNQNQLDGEYRTQFAEQWYRWMNRKLADNVPYDKIVEGLVLAVSRSSSEQKFEEYSAEMTSYMRRNEPADFAERDTMPHYWMRNNVRKSNEKALSFSYAFLGVRLQCAECHKHPFDQWSQDDFKHFTAFFDQLRIGNRPEDRPAIQAMQESIGTQGKGDAFKKELAKRLQEGEVIPFRELYVQSAGFNVRKDRENRKKEKGKQVQNARVITPKVLGGGEITADHDDIRQPLMQWLRSADNPYFAKAFVNRVWAHYFNVGIVEPADDMNLANAPSNRELLDYLASEFVRRDYDIKWLHREIANSRAYQLSWKPNQTNELDARNFSHAVPRRLQAEVIYDAIVTATSNQQTLNDRATDPVTTCAIGAGQNLKVKKDAVQSTSGYAMAVFGKPLRETTCDCERSNSPTLLQTIYLRNDSDLQNLIAGRNSWLAELNKSLSKDKQPLKPEQYPGMVRILYLRTLTRVPTDDELARATEYIAGSRNAIDGFRDVIWALVNTKEFMLNH